MTRRLASAWHPTCAVLAKSLAAALGAYLTAAVVLGFIPINGDWVQPARGILVALRTNGVHAEIALPIKTDVIDWATELYEPLVTYQGARPGYVSFGWGDARFYVETRAPWEIRPLTALSALLGLNGSVLHVEHIPGPSSAYGDVAFTVTPEQYARLVTYIRGSLRRTPDGLAILATDATFGHGDRFYAARGHYGPISTCNEWVRRGLASAGIRTATWSPFDWAVLWWARG